MSTRTSVKHRIPCPQELCWTNLVSRRLASKIDLSETNSKAWWHIIVRASNIVEILRLNVDKGSWLWKSKNMSPWCQWSNQTLLKNELLQCYLSGIFENNFKWLPLQGETLAELLLSKIRYLVWEIDFKITKVIVSTP